MVLFAIVVMLSLPLVQTAVPGGVLDHQAAGSAAEVDRIQQVWRAAGLEGQARIAVLGDLLFIGVYGLGSLLGGLWLRRTGQGAVRVLGMIAALTAIIFTATDYVETIAQAIQLFRFQGSDALALLAAVMRPVKTIAFLIAGAALISALLLRRIRARVA
ncbi:hypothetical protein [Qipengyuania marisflavi]|uniref:Uncharacterized protein n=1 Tax=Qipengyuania marisflavi TaxID=2486356 RepID=A0A5S3P9H5_9SPHN|nr:hypothetical protein [Qipengyuania marisflavi]TMM50111.1 hypothetical protein FEV51_02655 [Qipengyuania marisflavi]